MVRRLVQVIKVRILKGHPKGSIMDDLVYRLRKRAEIRRGIATRKSVQNGEPDRIADLLDEAADRICSLTDR